MRIFIDNKQAAIKKGTSFEYVSENRLFSGSDGYSFNISFPLKGCEENIAIFGHIYRPDFVPEKTLYDCKIIDRNLNLYGSLTITEISESEVKAQFLQGRSESNFENSFDTIFINEMNLGRPPYSSKNAMTPAQTWNPQSTSMKCVALPWVNDYSGNIQNKADVVMESTVLDKYHYEWSKETTGISWQPYLIYIAKRILDELNYSYDFTDWENNEETKYLIICNTLPYAWFKPHFADALPHWSVAEFFSKLELFLGAEFDFDHRHKKVSFAFTHSTLLSKNLVHLKDVIEEHSFELSEDEKEGEYLESKNLVYKECDHDTWKFYSCDWFIKENKDSAMRFKTLSDLLRRLREEGFASWDGAHEEGGLFDKLFYAGDCDAYFIIQAMNRERKFVEKEDGGREYKWIYSCVLRPINLFGGSNPGEGDEEVESEEIEFVPVRIDETDAKSGKCMFLNFAAYDDDNDDANVEDSDSDFMQSFAVQAIKAGEKKKKAEFYDRIYIGFWDGSQRSNKKLPYPWVENIEISDDWKNFQHLRFSLRLNNKTSIYRTPVYRPDIKRKATFKFVADTIPDVRAPFIYNGKRYICEKITATFSESGMSQLLKGVFYPV